MQIHQPRHNQPTERDNVETSTIKWGSERETGDLSII
jgi:hypothetical protein